MNQSSDYELENPFAPSEIVSGPNEFFGRDEERRIILRRITNGSIAIQGPIGIGKSSLLAKVIRTFLDRNDPKKFAHAAIVGRRDISSSEDLARLILDQLVEVDEKEQKIKFGIKGLFEFESKDLYRNYADGRHIPALSRLIADWCGTLDEDGVFIVAIDEADKCPVPIARVVRALVTDLQHKGVRKLRFILAGVSQYYEQLIQEDNGVSRFFSHNLVLYPMPPTEATTLLETKFSDLIDYGKSIGLELFVDPDAIDRVVQLSGGHPHLLQLLGYHLVENENEDPDNAINTVDLHDSLRSICYDDRGRVYEQIIRMFESENKMRKFYELISIASSALPTSIDRKQAEQLIGMESIEWFIGRNILVQSSSDEFKLVDEFLRIRLIMDRDTREESAELERRLVQRGEIDSPNDFEEDFEGLE